jgi:hypothetical protein
VVLEIDYKLGDRDSISDKEKTFFLLHCFKTGSATNKIAFPMSTTDSFPESKASEV